LLIKTEFNMVLKWLAKQRDRTRMTALH